MSIRSATLPKAESNMTSLVLHAPKVALISGSLRKASFNTQLIGAAERVSTSLGMETTTVDLAHFNLPLYHQDLEADGKFPDAARALKTVLGKADAWIVSSPEYNGFISPLLLNAYTWCSRGDDSGTLYATFRGKVATILSCSPGAMGGLRTLNPHREILTNLGVNVLPQSIAIGGAFKAFDSEGNLVDEKQKAMLQGALEALFYLARDQANRDATCAMVKKVIAGEYGSVSLPQNA